jgi:nucleoside-diphosphate-sugar epimerase
VEKLRQANIEVAYGDLKDRESLQRALEGVDIVYHAGAAMRGGRQEYFETTIRGTEWMLELAQAANVKRFVHISSVTVYRVHDLPPHALIDENCPYEPHPERVGAYAHSKVEAEKLAFRYVQLGLPVVVVRPGLIYGPCGRVMYPHIGYYVHKKLFFLVGRGDSLLPFVYIDNTVDGILRAAASEKAIGQAYNLADDGLMTQKEYLGRYMTATNAGFIAVSTPFWILLAAVYGVERLQRLGVLRQSPTVYGLSTKYKSVRIDSSKARRELNWQPRVGLEEGLRRTFEWHATTLQALQEATGAAA